MTRSLREHQSAYEDRARDIQERISTCRDAFRDARDVLDDLCPKDNDSAERKTQLSDRITLNILQLQAHAGVYDTAVSDWDDLAENYNIDEEDSDWAESMRVQRAQFFSLSPTLAGQFQDLIATYEDYYRRVEGSAATEANVSTDTNTSKNANGAANPGKSPANSAGTVLREAAARGEPDPANTAGMDDPERTPTRPAPVTETIAPAVQGKPPRRVRICEEPTEIDEFGDLSLRSEATSDDEYYYDASPVLSSRRTTSQRNAAAEYTPTSTPLSGHRSPIVIRQATATHGLFAHTDSLVTNASPMGWYNHHAGDGRHHETRTFGAPTSSWTDHARVYDSRDADSRMPHADASPRAASAAPAARAANSAAGSAGTATGSTYVNPSPPTRAADDRSRFVEHRDRLRHVLRDAKPPAGGGRYSAAPSVPDDRAPAGPPPGAWTTHPPHGSAYNRPRSPPPPPPVDYGVDFARENASIFYQKGTYSRTTVAKPPPVVLKELPIQKFSGSYRAYPMFRNRFLETIGHRLDLEPRHKFQYLLQYLEGEPFNHANGYLLTDENYFKVLDHLEDRYGDQSTLVTLLSQDFVAMGNVSSTSKDLRRFHDAALRLADEMEQLGQDVDLNVMWRQTMFGKMPQTLRAKIFENLGKDPMTTPIREVLGRISDYARILEKSEMYFSWNAPADRNSARNGQLCRAEPRSTPHRTGTYAADADMTHAANSKQGQCPYCGRNHWASKCTVYVTIGQRLKRIRQLDFCFLCLKGGHWSGTCPKRTNEACRHCHVGQHHQSICRQAYPGGRQPTSSFRPRPVSAITPGGHGILKNGPHGGPSSAQDVRELGSAVNRTDKHGESPATLRLSSTQQRSGHGTSNSKNRRRGRSKDQRTDPQGRNGTTRPTTACIDENVTQMDANACGGDGHLSDHPSHLTTDRRSNPIEVRCADWGHGTSTGQMPGIPDVSWERVPSDEEASIPDSTGHCSDAETEPPAEDLWADDPSWFATIDQDYSGYAVSTTSPADNHAVLLECLKTTAINIDNGISRSVIVFLDSGSNASYISMKLALDLGLPNLEKRYFRVNTFGTDVTTTISGFTTTLFLRSPQGYTLQLALTASDRIVPPVTTAIVTDEEVAQLERNDCALISTRETPDLLIGQDLLHLFQRRFGPTLPNGFQVVWSCLGPMLGGAGKVAHNRRAAATTNAAATSDPEPPNDTSTAPPSVQEPPPPAPTQHLGYNPEDPLNLWTIDDPAPDPANSAGTETEASVAVPANSAGSARDDSTVVETTTHLCSLLENNDADLFGDFSRVENAGIGTCEMTPDDQAAADMLKKVHKRHPDGRYEVPLLFRTPDGEPPSNDDLPTNAPLARGRSFSTRKMLVGHPKKLLDYHSVILDWQARGFIKEAPKNTQRTKHLLSHHPVFKETSTTTATRPVYDASAKLPGRTCLNDWLYRGPMSLPDVPAILLRSRPPKIVVLADISKAFLQMEVKESHKDCLRFYWFRDPFKEPTDDNCIEYRFERVPFGLKSAPYLLAGVIQLHLESIGTPLALEMLKNCYVDNVLLTADTVNEALAKYREAKEIFAQIGMPLREFASNSAEFNTAVDPADRADLTKLKELGIRWDILSDYWDIPLMPKQALPANSAGLDACLAASSVAQGDPANSAGNPKPDSGPPKKRKGSRKKKDDGRLTKRTMLRLVARIFDPQGLVQAVTLLLKLVIQEAWKLEKDWDDEITGELADLWKEAIKDFDSTVIRVPRRIAKGTIKSVEIHVFTDGSSYAYGFTAYLRVKNADRTYSTNLVYARARVKPIKDAEKFTIPRMELLGVLLGTRIAAYIHKGLLIPVSATYLWSDSTIVLHQVANDDAIKEVWTENRLKEIRRLRDELKIQFRYVPTDDNPADIVSRGLPAAELQRCEKWWHGAPFLALDSSRWPEQPTTLRTRPSPSDQPTELYGSTAFTTLFLRRTSRRPRAQWIRQRSQRKKTKPLDTNAEPLLPTCTTDFAVTLMVDAANSAAKPAKFPSEPILPLATEEKYDRWPRLVRIQYYVIRFIAACLRHLLRHLAAKNKQRRHAPALGFDLSQCLTTLGRTPTLRDLQLVTMIILRKTQLRHPPSLTDRRNLGIFESQGLLYVKGRLGNMKLRPTALTPLYLPREARDTELIILEYHRIHGHAQVATTLANLRMRYWFTKGRSTINRVLRKYCFACRRESMHPYAVPPWPQLPTTRVTNARPFYCTGLDLFRSCAAARSERLRQLLRHQALRLHFRLHDTSLRPLGTLRGPLHGRVPARVQAVWVPTRISAPYPLGQRSLVHHRTRGHSANQRARTLRPPAAG
ncbi:Pao retrotransposon peptidase family protein [Aphelenchoides avenae]|nr:Pao retrotransposon peptidase family protein [Aphelenchus avenae]